MARGRRLLPLVLNDEERDTLERWLRRRKTAHALGVRHGDELLPVSAPVHDVLVRREEGVACSPKIREAEAKDLRDAAATRAGVGGAGEARGHRGLLDGERPGDRNERPKRQLEYGAARRGDPRLDLLASDRRVSRSKTCFTARERFLKRNSSNAGASPQLGIHQDGAGPDPSRESCPHRALCVKARELATHE